MLVHYTARHGADVWQTYGRCFKGMLLIKRDGLDVGLPLLAAGVEELRSARFVQYYTGLSPRWQKASRAPGRSSRVSPPSTKR